ncbi:coagulation factor VII isoform X2 [Corythoichthys intestinalis]|uniref:coagulation factor VII isoform X2 n=1 Tax=Corythoichthys intestinalis TaxID=161448 RepID=UPI0025A67D41|nr:coagulation factor VII isoform X2 [Corythoichthys intestinalis]
MAKTSRNPKQLFFLGILVVCIPACIGLPEGLFLGKPDASIFLHRTRRANFFWEELKQGNLERECLEEKCSYEEAKEIFALPQQLEVFWRMYTARVTANGCRYRNGGCEHFCKELPDRTHICFCATGYSLDQNNSTCSPQDPVPCGRPMVHFAPRVVNGEICPKGHCPWQALLTENHQQTCGAIILSDQWILTAAHCVWRKPNSILHVIVGEHDLETDEKTEQKRRVSKVLIHRGYNHSSYDSDLAMLKLHRPIKLGLYVVPICLPARNSSFSRTLAAIRQNTVSGWGRLSLHGSTARLLQRVALPRVPLQECRLHTKLNITRNMLCAGLQKGGQDACKGDSGGPLVTRYKKTWFLTGVVSWGNGCAQNNMYGIYTKVSNFLDWIQYQMSRW